MHDQGEWRVRFDWGLEGLHAISAEAQAVVIVDVLRFSTAVEVAVSRGAAIMPYPALADAKVVADHWNAEVAGRSEDGAQYSLSPVSMQQIPPEKRLILPSPNGAALSHEARHGSSAVFAACLRNAPAVAWAAAQAARGGGTIAVVAAGERWGTDRGALRPAVEDLLGAGAVIDALDLSVSSPEARAAAAAFRAADEEGLHAWILRSASGAELMEKGCEADIHVAAAFDVSQTVPVLDDGWYVAAPTRHEEETAAADEGEAAVAGVAEGPPTSG
jgi:2-phosphosulfolactate phosphatase